MIAGTTRTTRPRATTSGTETTSRRFPAPSAIWETGSAAGITRRLTRARASSAVSAVKSAIFSTCRSRSRSSTAISSAEPASAALRRKASVRAIWRPPIRWAARNMPSARSRYPSRWACPTNTRCEAMSSATSAPCMGRMPPKALSRTAPASAPPIGFGVIWKSPFGPLAVDFAIPVAKASFDQTQVINFNVGTNF